MSCHIAYQQPRYQVHYSKHDSPFKSFVAIDAFAATSTLHLANGLSRTVNKSPSPPTSPTPYALPNASGASPAYVRRPPVQLSANAQKARRKKTTSSAAAAAAAANAAMNTPQTTGSGTAAHGASGVTVHATSGAAFFPPAPTPTASPAPAAAGAGTAANVAHLFRQTKFASPDANHKEATADDAPKTMLSHEVASILMTGSKRQRFLPYLPNTNTFTRRAITPPAHANRMVVLGSSAPTMSYLAFAITNQGSEGQKAAFAVHQENRRRRTTDNEFPQGDELVKAWLRGSTAETQADAKENSHQLVCTTTAVSKFSTAVHPRMTPMRVAERVFEAVKATQSEDLMRIFLASFPKVDLHLHAGGVAHPDKLIKRAGEVGAYFDPTDFLFYPDAKHGRILAADLQKPEHKDKLATLKDLMSMAGCPEGANKGHVHFFNAFKYINSILRLLPLKEQVSEVVQYCRSENIIYAEPMLDFPLGDLPDGFEKGFDQRTLPQSFELLQTSGWLKKYVAKQWAELKKINEEVSKELALESITHTQGKTTLGFLVEVMNDIPKARFFAFIAAGWALEQHSQEAEDGCRGMISGIGVCGPEHEQVAIDNTDAQLAILDALHGNFPNPHLAMHGGELSADLVPSQVMTNRLKNIIVKGHANRIGHAVSIANEADAELVLDLMRQRKVMIEACFSSTKNILGKPHPAGIYRLADVPVTFASDDPGVNNRKLTDQITKWIPALNLKLSDLRKITQDSIIHAGQPDDRKARLWKKLDSEFNQFAQKVFHRVATYLMSPLS